MTWNFVLRCQIDLSEGAAIGGGARRRFFAIQENIMGGKMAPHQGEGYMKLSFIFSFLCLHEFL